MKNTSPCLFLVLSGLILCLCSCSFNQFSIRKNHHPRVRVEAISTVSLQEIAAVNSETKKESPQRPGNRSIDTLNPTHQTLKHPTKETLAEKMIKVFFPKKVDVFQPIVHPSAELGKGNDQNMEGDRVAGLIVGTLALAFGIAALFMIIGMAHGNVWVYFVIGLILAVAATIMGFIGKQLPWKAFSIIASYLGILAIVLLLIFLVLIEVVHIAF